LAEASPQATSTPVSLSASEMTLSDVELCGGKNRRGGGDV
jgi:hypothetical protein